MLVEIAWHYRHDARTPRSSPGDTAQLPKAVTEIAWTAQQLRLTAKYKRWLRAG